MDFDYSQKVKTLSNHLVSFMDKNIYPNEIFKFVKNNFSRFMGEVHDHAYIHSTYDIHSQLMEYHNRIYTLFS